MEIVIDFDGTVVTHDFPAIGKDIGAAYVLRRLTEHGHKLILFTMRSDHRPVAGTSEFQSFLTPAVQWFKDNLIPLYGVQYNPTQGQWTGSPKAYGQLIIDDAALGCPLKFDPAISDRPFVDWVKVRKMLVKQGLLPKSKT